MDTQQLKLGIGFVLVQNGRRTEAEILPPIYQALKAVAHMPFAVLLMFDQSDFQPLSDTRVSELRENRKLIVGAHVKIIRKGQAATAAGHPRAYALDHCESSGFSLLLWRAKSGIIRRVKYW
jgi:hypothetical protein